MYNFTSMAQRKYVVTAKKADLSKSHKKVDNAVINLQFTGTIEYLGSY